MYSGRANNYAKQVYSIMYTYPGGFDPFSATCSRTDGATNPCFSITILDSKFSNFGLMKAFKTFPTWVNPTYKLQYSGMVLDLVTFLGPISIKSSTFANNYVRYATCQAGLNIKNNFNGEDNYPSYGTKTKI